MEGNETLHFTFSNHPPTQQDGNDEKNFEFGQSESQKQSAVRSRTCDKLRKFDFSDRQNKLNNHDKIKPRANQNPHMIRKICLIFSLFLSASAFLTPNARRGTATSMKMADFSLDPSCTAFVFIEYQNEFTTEGGKLHDAVLDVMEKTVLENSSRLADYARTTGCIVVHLPINFEKGHREIAETPYGILAGVKEGEAFTNGEWGSCFVDAMMPQPGDLVVKGKSGLCGFETTNLDFLLRQRGTKNIVLGGFLTNCCVESTMRSAYEKGYKVYTLMDCTAATSMEAHEATIKHNFGMFSVPVNSEDIKSAISVQVV